MLLLKTATGLARAVDFGMGDRAISDHVGVLSGEFIPAGAAWKRLNLRGSQGGENVA
jgi:hypothetical protein